MSKRLDPEVAIVTKLLQMLAMLDIPSRQRVLDYVVSRANSLPVIAAVGGGTEDDDPTQPDLPYEQANQPKFAAGAQ